MSIDLHIHSTASDGSMSPEQIVKMASCLKFKAIAITDHDTVEGLESALKAGEKYNLEVIPGIEINTDYKGYEVHILGYFIDYNNKKLLNKMNELKKMRKKRAYKMVERLNDLNINIDWQDVLDKAKGGSIGRTHIARVIFEQGYVDSPFESFEKYIAIDGPAYVKRKKITPGQAIDLIRTSSGLAVLAHPGIIDNDDIVYEIINDGIDGIEAIYYEYNKRQIEKYKKLAIDNNLLITGGSDDHGPGNKDGLRLGKIRIDYEYLQHLKEKIRKR